MPAEQADAVREAIDSLGDVAPARTTSHDRRILPHRSACCQKSRRRASNWMELPSTNGCQACAVSPAEQLEPIDVPRANSSSAPVRSFRQTEPLSPAAATGCEPSVPFRFLAETSSDALARYLKREHPQTVAVVLSHLTSDRAAEVLALLPAQFQGEVTLRLVHLDDTHPEVLADIERGMQSWMLEQSQALRRRTAGLATLARHPGRFDRSSQTKYSA